MTDRELLELAAKAAGIELSPMEMKNVTEQGDDRFIGYLADPAQCPRGWFDPLRNDGDALRLAVRLGLVVDCSRPSAGEPYKQHAIWLDELMSNEELTRRAITRAAAEIGRAMP